MTWDREEIAENILTIGVLIFLVLIGLLFLGIMTGFTLIIWRTVLT